MEGPPLCPSFSWEGTERDRASLSHTACCSRAELGTGLHVSRPDVSYGNPEVGHTELTFWGEWGDGKNTALAPSGWTRGVCATGGSHLKDPHPFSPISHPSRSRPHPPPPPAISACSLGAGVAQPRVAYSSLPVSLGFPSVKWADESSTRRLTGARPAEGWGSDSVPRWLYLHPPCCRSPRGPCHGDPLPRSWTRHFRAPWTMSH